ncbi:hypothetical protein N7488_011778 [Penicillium malachiteum]|nr:hypothetical protein N7488_011778 [Penicillium malachiteum]
MAPFPRADLIDMDHPSSDVGDSQDQDSPLRRQFSEPFRPQSTSTQISQSPEPLAPKIKCDWCGKLLELPNDHSISAKDLLHSHIASSHPRSNSFGYDGADDEDDDVDADEEIDVNDDVDVDGEGDVDDDLEIEGDIDEELDLEQDEPMNDAQFEEGEEAYQAEEGEDAELGDDAAVDDVEELLADEAEDQGFEDPQLKTESATPFEHDNDAPNELSQNASVSNNIGQQAPEEQRDLMDWLANPQTGYPEEYRRRLAEWQEADIKKRLPGLWNVNKATKFSDDYEKQMEKAEASWKSAFNDPSKKIDGSESMTRPSPYTETETSTGQFLELGEFDDLVAMLKRPNSLTPEQLYAATEAAAVAMKAWQDEYLALDKLYNAAHRHNRGPVPATAKREQMLGHKKRTNHPLANVPQDERDFAERHEAALYGYKYNYNHRNTLESISWIPQDPFVQGGFVPTAAQARKMATKVAPGERNPDGWTPIVQHGVEFVPKMYQARSEPVQKITRKRKAVEVETAKSESDDDQSDKGDETEDDNQHPPKRRSRGRGGRRNNFEPYQPPEPPTSAPRGRGGARSRGRGRGRGGPASGRTISSRASQEAPAQTTLTPTSTRGRGRRGASNISTPQARPVEEVVTAASMPEISPMPEPASPPPRATPVPKRDATAEEIEEARRLKIANSKNPKRTKAMLDHWERFNREGRIRNPKRSKAQIEQDRQVDDKKTDVSRPQGRRRKSPSLVPIPTGNLAPKVPAVAHQMPGPLAPGPTLPPIGMPQYAPPNPFVAHPQPSMPHYAAYPYQYGMGHLPGPPPGPHDHHYRGV